MNEKPNFPQFPQFGSPDFSSLPPVKSTTGLITKVVAVVIILGIIGTGVFALATRKWDPVWNPFRPAPEKVLKEMSAKMKEVKSFHYESEMKINATDGKDGTENNFSMSMLFSGKTDKTDPENPKGSLDFSFDFGKPSEGLFSLGGKIKTIGKDAYFKLTTFSVPQPELFLSLMMMGIDIDKIKEQWIKANEDEIEELNQELINGRENELKKAQQKEIEEKIKKLFEGRKIYYVKKELPDEKKNEKRFYRYVIALDKKELKKIFPDLVKISIESSPEKYEFPPPLMEGVKEILTEKFSEFLDKIGEMSAEVWIGKEDLLLYKIKVRKQVDASKFEKTAEGKTSISFDLEFSDFNLPVEVKIPDTYIDFKDIFEGFIKVLREASLKGKNARIMNEMARFRVMAEDVYLSDESYINVSCRNENIKQICENIKQISGMEPIIHQSREAYCAYTKLLSLEEGKVQYWCIDSEFSNHMTEIDPGREGYCDGKTFICPPGFMKY